MFITFEGPEGCGKSTHAKELKAFLGGQGREVVLTQEPGGTPVGEKIRDLLLYSDNEVDKVTELCLFAADRAEQVSRVIKPALSLGKMVISDRFIDSTLAYQIGGRGLAADLVRYVNMISSGGLIPDITFLLDLSPEAGLKRAGRIKKADRFEKEKVEFHRKVRDTYLEIAKDNPQRVKVIDTEQKEIFEVQEIIRKILNEKLGN